MAINTALNKKSQDFVTYLSNGVRPRSKLTSLAVAKFLASRLLVPVGEVDELASYYSMSCSMQVKADLSKLNEVVPLDTDTILDYAERFFVVRYYAVNPKPQICCLNTDTVLQDFFGISYSVDQTTLDEIKTNPVELTKVYNDTYCLFQDLSGNTAS